MLARADRTRERGPAAGVPPPGPRTGVPLAALACLVAALCAPSTTALAQARFRLNVPAASLQAALSRVAVVTGAQIVFDARATRGRRSPPLRGDYAVGEALDVLLAGSGLDHSLGQSGIIIVRPRLTSPVLDPAPAFQVEDVVVTARRRDERLIDVPIAVTNITGRAVEDRGARTLADFLQEAPGVGIYDTGSGISKVTIRGISTSLGANENGYYLDDLPFTGVTVPIAPDVRAWDLDRVEVLRGPQGTLFGEGAMGGTIRILTADADLDEYQARANASASRTDGGGENQGIKGAVNLPIITDVLAVRLAATHETFDGWIDNGATGEQDVNEQAYDTFRAKVLFEPTERLSLRASYWSSESEFPNGGATASDDGRLSRSVVLATGQDYRLIGASARYDLGGSGLFYGYSGNAFDRSQDGSLLGGVLTSAIAIEVDSHELRWSSTDAGPLQWTIGAYRRVAARRDRTLFPLFDLDNRSDTDTKAEAVFGEGTYTLPQAPVDITVGLRHFRDDLRNQDSNGAVAEPEIRGGYSSWNPRLSLAWRPRDDMTLYASAAKGFRSGQVQPSTSLLLADVAGVDLPPTLGQDTIWTYEIGAKADLFGRRLLVEAAAYYSQWDDVVVRIPIADTGFNGLINSQGTETRGVELSLVGRPLPGLTLAASASYIDAEYVGFVSGTGIATGAPVDDVASFTANASVDYGWSVRDGARGFARLSWQHTSPRRFDSFPEYRPGDTIDRVDARLGLAFDALTVALFADNLANDDGAIASRQVFLVGPGDLDVTSPRLRPRTLGLEVTFPLGRPGPR